MTGREVPDGGLAQGAFAADRLPDDGLVPERPAARVLLLDADDRVLLFRVRSHEGVEDLWVTPGGGIEPGETPEEAARREVLEETGLAIGAGTLGPGVWHRRHRWRRPKGEIDLVERFYVARCEAFAPRAATDTEEHRNVLAYRWWSAAEMEAAHGEVFAPRRFAVFLRDLLRTPPPGPVDVGV